MEGPRFFNFKIHINMEKLVNLTPHPITIIGVDGKIRTIPAQQPAARVLSRRIPAGVWAGVELVKVEFGEVAGLPDPEPGTIFIVSTIVRTAAPHRTDLASPAATARDAAGNITGCYNLAVSDGQPTKSDEIAALDARIEVLRGLVDELTAHEENTEWVSATDARSLFPAHLPQSTFYKYISEGKIPAHKFGKVLMFKRAEIQEFINSRKK